METGTKEEKFTVITKLSFHTLFLSLSLSNSRSKKTTYFNFILNVQENSISIKANNFEQEKIFCSYY
jgi:hypothetical protein